MISPLRKLSTLALLTAVSALMTATLARSATCPGADQEALAWLDKMSRSLHEVSYHGVVTLQRGEDLQVMQVSHAVEGESTSEQLTKLTGQGAQVERTDHPLHCVHPGHRLLQIGASCRRVSVVSRSTTVSGWLKESELPAAVPFASWLSPGTCTASVTSWNSIGQPVSC